MKTFEIGKEYATRSICDHNCIFTIKITGRTAKTVTYEYSGRTHRSKIRVDNSGEYIQPDRYSMAPSFHAATDCTSKEAPAIVEESTPAPAPVVENAAPSNVVTIAQPADDGSLIVMIGQAVEMNCGSCYPLEKGKIIGFISAPGGRVSRGMFALVSWESRPGCPQRVHLSNIHRQGWRSAGGSPLGVFVC